MDFLSHYYKKDELPFRSLSELSQEEALAQINNYDPGEALVYRRFKNPHKYLEDRKKTEHWLYSEFNSKGGAPDKVFPHYLVLGESGYIFDGYNGECNKVTIPIDQIDKTKVSFTYPDSMVSYWLRDQKSSEAYFQPNYHGIVFTLDEVFELLDKVGHYEKVWESEETRSFDFFVEAQLWSDNPILDIMKCL